MIGDNISDFSVGNDQIISVTTEFPSLCQIPVIKSVLHRLSMEEYNSL